MAASFEDNSTGQPKDDALKSTAPARTESDEDNDNDDDDSQEEDDDEEEEEEDDDEDEQPPLTRQARMQSDRAKIEALFLRLSTERVPVRVHDVLIKGNAKTKDSLIEAEVEALKTTTTVQELLQAAGIVNARLPRPEICRKSDRKSVV